MFFETTAAMAAAAIPKQTTHLGRELLSTAQLPTNNVSVSNRLLAMVYRLQMKLSLKNSHSPLA